jgi:acetyltransferase-like isoleucine patch superfamily enzyme
VHNSARIGFCLLAVDTLRLGQGTRIASFNYFRCRRVTVRQRARIGSFNYFSGPFSILLSDSATIGRRNVFKRSELVRFRPALLRLGRRSSFSSGHYVNLDASVLVGAESVVGGIGCQFWTHGFVHMSDRRTRSLVLGAISIGDNVYIGSGSVLNPGTCVGRDVSIAANASVSGNVSEPGFYVSQPLRHIPRSPEARVAALERLPADTAGHPTYWKRG